MALSSRDLWIVIRARDEASRALKNINNNFKDIDKTAAESSRRQMRQGQAMVTAGVGIAAVGTGMAAALKGAVDESISFNKAATLTLTQVDDVSTKLEDVKKVAIDVGRSVPAPFEQMQGALYDIFSSMDVNVAQSKVLLTSFSKTAVAGNVSIEDSSRATIGIMNAYQMKVEEVHHVQDVMFQLVRKGVGTYGQFASVIGRAVPSAVRAGQSIEDLSGMMAFLTRNGLSAAMASSSAARALDAISHPKTVAKLANFGQVMKDSIGEGVMKSYGLGVKDMALNVKDSAGKMKPMTQIIQELQDRMGKLTDIQKSAVLQELFKGSGGTIQARRFFDPAIRGAKQLTDLTQAMHQSAGEAGKAYDKMAETAAAKQQDLNNQWSIAKVELGDNLLPIYVMVVEHLSKLVKWFGNLSDENKKYIAIGAAVIAGMTILVGAITAVAGSVLILTAAVTRYNLTASNGITKLSQFAKGMVGIKVASTTAIVATETLAKAEGTLTRAHIANEAASLAVARAEHAKASAIAQSTLAQMRQATMAKNAAANEAAVFAAQARVAGTARQAEIATAQLTLAQERAAIAAEALAVAEAEVAGATAAASKTSKTGANRLGMMTTALTVGVIAVYAFGKAVEKMQTSMLSKYDGIDEITSKIKNLGSSAQDTGKLLENIWPKSVNKAQFNLLKGGFQGEYGKNAEISPEEQYGAAVGKMKGPSGFSDMAEGIGHWLGVKSDWDIAKKGVEDIDTALANLVTSGNVTLAAKQAQNLTKILQEQGRTPEEIAEALKAYNAALKQTGDANTRAATSALATKQAYMTFKDGLGTFKKAIKENGAVFDDNTKKGRANQQAVMGAMDAARNHADAVYKQTGSMSKANAAFKSDMDAMLKTKGVSKDLQGYIASLTDAYLNIPSNLETTLTFRIVTVQSIKESKVTAPDYVIAVNTYMRKHKVSRAKAEAAINKKLGKAGIADTANIAKQAQKASQQAAAAASKAAGDAAKKGGGGGGGGGGSKEPAAIVLKARFKRHKDMMKDAKKYQAEINKDKAAIAALEKGGVTKDEKRRIAAYKKRITEDKAALKLVDTAKKTAAAVSSAAKDGVSKAKSIADVRAASANVQEKLDAAIAARVAAGQKISKKAKKKIKDYAKAQMEIIAQTTTTYNGVKYNLDTITTAIDNAKEALADLKAEAADYKKNVVDAIMGTSIVSGSTYANVGISGYLRSITKQVENAQKFTDNLDKLGTMGLDPALIKELSTQGPEAAGQFVAMLTRMTPEQIAQVNAQQKTLADLAEQYAQKMTDQYYQAGINAAEGFVAGLENAKTGLLSTMRQLADALVVELNKRLGAHSPARKLIPSGVNTVGGIVVGLDKARPKLRKAMARVGDDMYPEGPGARVYDISTGGGRTVNQNIDIHTQEIDPRKHAADLGWELSTRVG